MILEFRNRDFSILILHPSAIIMSKCMCGRSPTGMCKGWHGLTNEEYIAKKKQYEEEMGE